MRSDDGRTINTAWYDLFSRGARDWLRHNQKVREAVQGPACPDLLAGADLITRPEQRTVLVPVRARARALPPARPGAAAAAPARARASPATCCSPAREHGRRARRSAGGTGDGEFRFVLELKVDEIVDWLWEELKLPDLKPKRSRDVDEPDYVREGWDKRGARSRLDRRRTVKEAIKRRAIQADPVPFTNDDLRFRQLVQRAAPGTNAAVSSPSTSRAAWTRRERRLAKQFFFFALQGIRRQYTKVETRVPRARRRPGSSRRASSSRCPASGGTVASSAFELALRHGARSATTRRATTPTSSTPRTARTPPRTARPPRAALRRARRARSTTSATSRPAGVATLPPRETADAPSCSAS